MPTPYEPKRSCPVNVISPATRLLDGMSTRFYAKERSLRGGNAEKQPRLGLAIRRL